MSQDHRKNYTVSFPPPHFPLIVKPVYYLTWLPTQLIFIDENIYIKIRHNRAAFIILHSTSQVEDNNNYRPQNCLLNVLIRLPMRDSPSQQHLHHHTDWHYCLVSRPFQISAVFFTSRRCIHINVTLGGWHYAMLPTNKTGLANQWTVFLYV